MKLKLMLTVAIMLSSIPWLLNAQVNGVAVNPVVSTIDSPLYFYVESASDSSAFFNGYSGDFRGNVIISPDVRNTKLIHNKIETAPSHDHALWEIIQKDGKHYLRNKATGFYMIGAHTVDTISTTNTFSWTPLGGNQFALRTGDATSYSITWKNNLLDRLNIEIKMHSLTAWYFIVANPEQLNDALKLSLLGKINEAQTLLENSIEGDDFGQYREDDRSILEGDIANAQAVYDYEGSSIGEIQIMIEYMDGAMNTYKQTINADPKALEAKIDENYRWYWIRNYGTNVAFAFNKVISTGGRVVGQQYIFEEKIDPPSETQLFRFVLNDDKTKVLNIIDKLGNHIAANGMIAESSTPNNEFTLIPQTDGIAFYIKPTSLAPLRANETGVISNWLYLAGGPSSWVIDFAYEEAKIPTFAQPRTINVSSSDNTKGSAVITGSTDTSITTDIQKVSVTAIPNSGYFFTRWTTLAGDSISIENPYVYNKEEAITLVANFVDGYYRDMSRFFTNISPAIQSADRYLTKVLAFVEETEQVIIHDITNNPIPVDTTVLRNQIIPNAVVDATEPMITVPLGVNSFEVVFFGSTETIESFVWTQQNVFIDWNKNYIFTDEYEVGERNAAYYYNPELIDTLGYVRNISIPEGTAEGIYRMRVIYHEPAAYATDWSYTIWDTHIVRNGIVYDFNIKLGSPSNVANNQQSNIKAFIINNKLRIMNADQMEVSVRDITGKLITRQYIASDLYDIDMKIGKGVYLVTIHDQSSLPFTIKVIR